MTDLLYLSDFNVETCDATVISCTAQDDGRYDIVLDQTCFYPRGGGQDWDTGSIAGATGTFQVDEVRLDAGGDVHHLAKPMSNTISAGEKVECVVDHARRLVNTRLHSAGHAIDMAVDGMRLGWIAGKGQHYPDLSAVEYTGTWNPDQSQYLQAEIERRVNQLVRAGGESSILFMPVKDMATICRYVPSNIPTNKPARVVVYNNDFGVPCGGTHVKNLNEIGEVKVPKIKYKKGVIRVSYSVASIN